MAKLKHVLFGIRCGLLGAGAFAILIAFIWLFMCFVAFGWIGFDWSIARAVCGFGFLASFAGGVRSSIDYQAND